MSQKNLNDIKLFVSTMMNDVYDEHARLLSSLKLHLGETKECDDAIRVLVQIRQAKLCILEKIYKEIG